MANNDRHIGICDLCRKRKYLSRAAAQTVVKRLNEDHMVAYRCPYEREYWHVGHLPTPVIRGGRPEKRHHQGEWMTNEYEAAVELEKARQSLRENQAAGKGTQTDAERVKEANKAYDEAKKNKK